MLDREKREPVQIADNEKITIRSGEHGELIRAIIEEFGPRFAPGSVLIYVGDTGEKWGYFDAATLSSLGVDVDAHGRMPDVVLYDVKHESLLLVGEHPDESEVRLAQAQAAFNLIVVYLKTDNVSAAKNIHQQVHTWIAPILPEELQSMWGTIRQLLANDTKPPTTR